MDREAQGCQSLTWKNCHHSVYFYFLHMFTKQTLRFQKSCKVLRGLDEEEVTLGPPGKKGKGCGWRLRKGQVAVAGRVEVLVTVAKERERVAMWEERSGGGGFEILFSFLSKEKGTEDVIEYAPIQSSHDRSVMDGSTDNKVIVIWNVYGGEVGIDNRFKERVRVSSVWYFFKSV